MAEKKSVKQGEVIGHIVPNIDTDKYISAIYPIQNIGKIEKGQRTIIKFDAFPFKQYGTIESVVTTISKIPELDKNNMPMYEIKINLNETIVTNYNDTIPFKPEMTAIVEIITEDRSILERIFDQFLDLIYNE